MTLFQILSISILLVLLGREMLGLWRARLTRGGQWLRAFVWLAAIAAIACPNGVQYLADTVGIDRGADFVFYLFVLVFLGVTFYFYSRQMRMRRQITQLVRHMALQEARQGSGGVRSEE